MILTHYDINPLLILTHYEFNIIYFFIEIV
jgi:hypothetical protein